MWQGQNSHMRTDLYVSYIRLSLAKKGMLILYQSQKVKGQIK